MRLLKMITLPILIICGCLNSKQVHPTNEQLEPFAISFGKETNLEEIGATYKLIIVEPDQFDKIETDSLNNASNKLLAYVTLGEVDRSRWYYPLLEEQGFLGVNENWDSPYIDLADSTSRAILLNQVIPNIMIKGYDGLFLDTIDAVAPYTERKHLQPYMVDLIKDIRTNYPEAYIIQNAGLFLLDEVHNSINAVLVEDVATSYNFNEETYNLRAQQEYEDKITEINNLSNTYNLPFLIVEYAEENELVDLTKSRLDEFSYPYFISTIELDRFDNGISSYPDPD